MKSFITTTITILIASALAVGGAYAADFTGLSSRLLGSAGSANSGTGGCPKGMVPIPGAGACIDAFESSVGQGCPFGNPATLAESLANKNASGCAPTSETGKDPWRNVSQTLAAELCAKAGKRLASGEEWFAASLGTPDGAACEGGSVGKTGSRSECVSGAGAYEMAGNAWEWTNETSRLGALAGAPLPEAGFVTETDTTGVPLKTDPQEPSAAYGSDRLWVDASLVAGVMRGGYWGSGTAAGIYALFAASPPSFSGAAVGFRCVR